MEEVIRKRIEWVKRDIKYYEAELKNEKDMWMRCWIRGRIAGLEQEMNTLEDLLVSWEEYQKFGQAIPF